MNILRVAIVVCAFIGGCADEPVIVVAQTQDPQSCIGCHEQRQPGLLVQWRASVHAEEGVECSDCHGDDHDAIFRAEGKVTAAACKECHRKETIAFRKSVHGRAMSDAMGNARMLMQIPAMQRLGCLSCHATGGLDPKSDDDGHCNACHGAHRYSAEDARQPESCGLCHRGPDHPHIEAYEASRHGVVWAATHDEKQAPTCVTCHMDGGDHDVSSGLTIGRAGSGAVLEGEEPPIPMKSMSAEFIREQRAIMLERCQRCHTPRVARRALEDADAIKRCASSKGSTPTGCWTRCPTNASRTRRRATRSCWAARRSTSNTPMRSGSSSTWRSSRTRSRSRARTTSRPTTRIGSASPGSRRAWRSCGRKSAASEPPVRPFPLEIAHLNERSVE